MNQKRRHKEWLKENDGKEHPTHLETLLKLEQQTRINWLIGHCDSKNILDIGCNWGYVLDCLDGRCGVDLNVENIDKAMKEFPNRAWLVSDVTKGLPFQDYQYEIVVMADVLEHLAWNDVFKSLKEALRIASKKLLVTLPWRQTDDCACCFKHQWIPHKGYVGEIVIWLAQNGKKVSLEYDDYFVYIEATR